MTDVPVCLLVVNVATVVVSYFTVECKVALLCMVAAHDTGLIIIVYITVPAHVSASLSGQYYCT